ncbi:MAG: DUF3048 domain-containing protein [Clostridia bacterium]|nr:DUF3048 domain-containing protein [Clostridia bacterium]
MRTIARSFFFALLVMCVCVFAVSCSNTVGKLPEDTTTSNEDGTTSDGPLDTTPPLTPETDTSAPESDSDTTAGDDTTDSDTTTEGSDVVDVPAYLNPLTGLPVSKDLSAFRPAAIMVNNIAVSCPQPGIASADIIYECLVEGGFTRLMAVSMDYTNLPSIGSIRSARHYYLAMAADYDALFIHIGGSTYAFDTIDEKGVNNVNGIEWYASNYVYWQDPVRLKNMGYEHSWLTNGESIAEGIKYKRYRTAARANFDYPVDFVEYGTTVSYENKAEHVHIPYSRLQTTDFVYDAKSGSYLRYQFDGKKHIDGTTGEQLAFDNVIVYYCETGLITNDALNRIDVQTEGTGTGFYATKGTYIPITWEKDSFESPIRFYTADGEPLYLNAGKTFISVCPTSIKNDVSLNYEW